MKPIMAAVLALGLVQPSIAHAAATPQPGPVDPRIRTIVFNPREVVTLVGQIGYQTVLSFGAGERIENISVGDSLAWQATPNKKADLLFLKPIDNLPGGTNMTVVTNMRRYNFELLINNDVRRRQQAFDIRFVYPNEEAEAAARIVAMEQPVSEGVPAEGWNFAYSFTGDKTNVPLRVFDDGRFTYFQWPDRVDTPAVFVIGADGRESLVNHMTRGRYFVVEQVASQFVLRSGTQVTQVFNDAMRPPEPGAAAPRERTTKSRRGRSSGGDSK